MLNGMQQRSNNTTRRLCGRMAVWTLLVLLFPCILPAELLYDHIMVNDVQRGNRIDYPATSRNLAVDTAGNLYVAFYGTNGVRVACSTNRGASFGASVQLSTANAECELRADSYGVLYLCWVESNQLMFTKSSNRLQFDAPRAIGTTESTVHMAIDSPYVYLIPRGGGPLFRNNQSGTGPFSLLPAGTNQLFSSLLVNPYNHTLYLETDDPAVSFRYSTNFGTTFSAPTTIGREVYYPSTAALFMPNISYLFIAGSGNQCSRIDLTTGSSQLLNVGNAIDHGRALATDSMGTLIDGYQTDERVFFAISTNYGTSFSGPRPITGSVTAFDVGVNPTYGDVVAVYEDSGQIFCNVYADEIVCTNADLRLSVSAEPAATRPEQPVIFHFSVTNASPVRASDVVISNQFPAGLEASDLPPSCTNQGNGLITCWIGDMLAFTGYELTLTGRTTITAGGRLFTRTTVSTSGSDVYPGNNSATTCTEIRPALQIVSPRSNGTPPIGSHINDYGSLLTNSIASPYVSASTQYICTGWTLSGNAPPSGSGNTQSMLHTNDAVLTWIWGTTNVAFSATSGPNGSVSAPANGWYQLGSSVSLTALPDPHQHFLQWTGDITAPLNTQNPLLLTLDRARSLTAQFSMDSHTLDVLSDHGSCSPSAGSHSYLFNTLISCTAPMQTLSGTQYICTGWTLLSNDPASGSTSSFSMTLTNNATLRWIWGTTNVELSAGTDGHGSLSGDTSGWYPQGTTIHITALPGDYEHFAGWSGTLPAALTNDNPLNLTLDQTRTLRANFTVEDRELSISSAHGAPSPAIGTHTYPCKTTINASTPNLVDGPPGTRYACTGWHFSNHSPTSGTNTSFSFSLTNTAHLSWNWKTQLLVQADTAGPGTLNAGSSNLSAWVDQGGSITITAVPTSAYTPFIGWSGTLPSGQTNDNPLTLSVSQPHSITAQFYTCETELEVISACGSPSPAPGHHTNACGETVFITANSPCTANNTQRLCTGWTMLGNAPTSGSGTSFTMTHTNDAWLTWHWGQTNVYFGIETNGSGTVTGSPSGWYPIGSSVTVTSIPVPGGSFIGWEQDVPPAQSAQNPLTLLLDQSRTIRARFTDVYKTLQVRSTYGTATPAVGTGSNLQNATLSCSVTTPIAAPDNTRYACTGWTLSGNDPATGTTPTFSLTLTNHAILTWNWKTSHYFSAQSSSNGTLQGSTSGWYDQNASLSITAVPNPGYAFCSWSGTLPAALTNDNPLLFTLDQSHSITACFKQAERIFTIQSSHGTAAPPVGIYTNLNNTRHTNQMLTATLTDLTTQRVCTGWSLIGNAPTSGTGLTCILTQTNSATLTWNWTTNVRLTCSATSGGHLSGGTNSWQPLGSNTLLQAEPDTGMAFTGWTGDLHSALTNQNPLTLTMDRARTITATFAPAIYTLQIRTAHEPVTPGRGTYSHPYNSVLTNTATASIMTSPSTQYVCTGWSLFGNEPPSGSVNSCTLTLTNNAILTWNWTTNVLLSWSTQGMGTVDQPVQSWHPLGNTVTLTATPDTEYKFDTWSGNIPAPLTNNNPLTLTMDQSRAITAEFSLIRQLDFVISGISVHSSPDRATVDATVSIQNIGTDTGSAGILTIWANRPTPAECGEFGDVELSVGDLTPGITYTHTFTNLHPGAGTGVRSCRAFIDANGQAIEEEKRNNQYAADYTYIGPLLQPFEFSAFALTSFVTLRWTAPTNCGLPNNRTRILCNTSNYPADSYDGTLVYQGTEQSCIHSNLTPQQTYYYSIWVNDGTYYIVPPSN